MCIVNKNAAISTWKTGGHKNDEQCGYKCPASSITLSYIRATVIPSSIAYLQPFIAFIYSLKQSIE